MRFVVVLCLASLCGCRTLPKANKIQIEDGTAKQREVHIASHGWHTGVIVESADLNDVLPNLKKRFPEAKYYELGWGDAGYYQANKITTRLTLRAVFWPSDTVVLVVGFDEDPYTYFSQSDLVTINISERALRSLIGFLDSSFKKDDRQNIIPTRIGTYGNSQFYEGVGNYFLFNTCNKWTAKALYSGGVEINPLLKLSSSSVMHTLRNRGK